MDLPSRLQRLAQDVHPPQGARERVWKVCQRRVNGPQSLERLRDVWEPQASARDRVWGRIREAIAPERAILWLEWVRGLLTPPRTLAGCVWRSLVPRLEVAPVRPNPARRFSAWVSAFVVLGLIIRLSPMLFLASPTVAESSVLLVPTRGSVFVALGSLWQPVSGEIALTDGMALRTEDGEATVVLRDEGVIRLDAFTSVTLMDTSRRLLSAPEHAVPTVRLHAGRVWVQGLVPAALRGFTVATSQGVVTVHEGSVSVREGDVVRIDVHNRRARLERNGTETLLIAGERAQLWNGSVTAVGKMGPNAQDDPWVTQNLERDAVHRRDIAQLQQERRAARAGILPTSPLYPVKRVAEAAELLMTLDPQERVEKQVAYATTRLDEAAALLKEGKSAEVAVPLEEYRKTLIALAAGSGGSTASQFILQQAIAEAAAENAALLPNDEGYLLKKAVLEAVAALPEGTVTPADVHGELLVDTLAALNHAVREGNLENVVDAWNDLQPHLLYLDVSTASGGLSPEMVREAEVLLEQFAVAVTEQGVGELLDPAFAENIAPYLPPKPAPHIALLSEEHVHALVQGILDRIYTYRMPRSRVNQVQTELKQLQGHAEEGRILRALYRALPPDTELLTWVRQAIARLRVERVGR